MIAIKISVTGVRVVRQGLENLRSDLVKVGRTRLREFAERIKARMQRYPSPLPRQRYVRTYTLQRSWRIEPMTMGYAISSDAVSPYGRHYTRYVVGDAKGQGQARIHKGRWPVFREVVERYAKDLPKSVIEALRLNRRIIQ